MTAWADVVAQARLLGDPCAVPSAEQLERWPCDLSEAMAALLAQGWPGRGVALGGCRAFGDPQALIAGLGSDWPAHLLPLARRDAEALGWDARRDRVVLIRDGQLSLAHPALGEWLALVAVWMREAAQVRCVRAGAWTAVDGASWSRLTQALTPAQLSAWTLSDCASAAEVAERLGAQRRQQLATARWTAIAVGLAPLLGWGLGASMQPPQAPLGAALAALVVGGAPSLLLAQAALRARQLLLEQRRASALDHA